MRRSTQIALVGVMFLTILVSMATGALAGGLAGYYLAQRTVANLKIPAITSVVAPSAEKPLGLQIAPTQAPLSVSPTTGGPKDSTSEIMISAVKKVAPAVVTVLNIGETIDLNDKKSNGSGSGVIISQEGYILTNNHVVEGARSLAVIFSDSSRHDAELVGADPLSDVAVIRIKDKVPAIATLGDSSILLPGEQVLTIGSPLGNFRNTVTAGVVSAVNRSVGDLEGLIQTDASINRGNSGGPLINLRGEVVGINTLVVRGQSLLTGDSAEGLGFAVPSSIFKNISEQLIKTGEIKYPYLGIRYTMIDGDVAAQRNLALQNGALVAGVEKGTPAESAGLKVDDIITAVNGKSLVQENSLRYVLTQYKPGDAVKLTVLREKKELSLSVTLATRPQLLNPKP